MQSLTPAMRQYLDIKNDHKDAIIFFRMGDFYEMFFEDAVVASRILGIALTSRDREKTIPMCGIPYHAASSYVARLVKEGHKVAICEQVEDPDQAKGIVRRAVSRIVTPGVTYDDEILEPGANNYVAAAYIGPKSSGYSYMDVSTGEFMVTELASAGALFDEIKRTSPLELLVEESQTAMFAGISQSLKKVTNKSTYEFEHPSSSKRLCTRFDLASLDGLGLTDLRFGVMAAGALLNYITETQKAEPGHIKRPVRYFTGDYLVIDGSSRRNLEITENIRTNDRSGTLLELMDKTRTSMGARRLKAWISAPLVDVQAINRRQSAVAELVEDREARGRVQTLLDGVYDMERLMARACMGAANPRDLVSLGNSLEKVPELANALAGLSAALFGEISASLDPVDEVVTLITAAIAENPPVNTRDGGIIRQGYNPELDELRDIRSGGKDWIARLEAQEREATGINSLKVGYNRVFGYYIEVTKTNLANVPENYIRKQTLVNAERYITPELKQWEEKILTAEEKARELESSLFASITRSVAGYADRVQKTADAISTLDAVLSLAAVSTAYGYTLPVVDQEGVIDIEGGRHPVIEAKMPDEFVPNDVTMDHVDSQVLILTGPNMAGKSTYLRQIALIVLMAQVGCFVPASRARVGVVDRIFTRIGASDDLSRGQSTFMVEMNETANILNNATSKSLVILDEIGRGTSTFDGLSIAWSVVEFIHDHPECRPKTLFATHYHELTDLSLTKERVKNYNMAVKEWNDKIIFLRKVVPGGSNRSYGIQVARLAGLPAEVVGRATEILKNLETGELTSSGVPRIALNVNEESSPVQMSLLSGPDPVVEELAGVDLDNTTPLEALNTLGRLKKLLKESK